MSDMGKPCVRFGPFSADLNLRELRKNGVRVRLGGQPFEILAALLERPGVLVTREELRKRIWTEDTFVDFSHGLNAAVNKLREALSDSAEEPRYIETLPRRGYRFIAQIERIARIPGPFVTPSTFTTQPNTEPMPKSFLLGDEWQPDVTIKRTNVSRLWAGLALLVFLAALGSKLLFEQSLPSMREVAKKELAMKQGVEQLALTNSPSIWRFDVARAAEANTRTRVASNQEGIAGPQPSPDGKKLAFMAGRAEEQDIWVSNADGGGQVRLTFTGRTGTPRWSPDSHWIAFDSDRRGGHSGIYVVPAEGGKVQAVVEESWNNSVPSWSRDGKWIYFASNRATVDDDDQVWKVSVENGQIVQVTHQGGFAAYESIDGRTVYYAKNRYENPEIWKVPVGGAVETRVSSLLRPSTWANWAVTKDGILFLSEYNEKASTLECFDFETRGVRPLGVLENASFWLSASADGKSVWYSELTQQQARLVFRAGSE